MNYRAVSCMLSAAMCLMNLLPPLGAGAAVRNPQAGAYPLFAAQTDGDASETADANKYKDEFYLHLDVFGNQVYETEAPIVNLSISDPSVALCIMSEAKDYLNIQALTSGICEIIVTLANGDVYAVHLTVGTGGK